MVLSLTAPEDLVPELWCTDVHDFHITHVVANV